MTNKQLFTKIIEKAVKGGWQDIQIVIDVSMSLYNRDEITIRYTSHFNETCFGNYNIYQTIFSHSFAKAFWGNPRKKKCCAKDCDGGLIWGEHYCPNCDGKAYTQEENWQYHLQQMILEKKPLKYLERFL